MVPKRTLRSAGFTFRTAEEAYVLTDEYQLPTYRHGYFAFGSDASGELLVAGWTATTSDRCTVWPQLE
jgi:hypothetical protein